MKRIIIKNTHGFITHRAEMEDPTQWIADGVSQNWWGLAERWKWKDECSEEELTTVLEEREVEIQPEVPEQGESPAIPAVTRIEARLAATYTIEIIDIDSEIQQEAQRQTQIRNLKQRLKELDAATDLTAAEVKEAIRKFIKLMILKRDFD